MAKKVAAAHDRPKWERKSLDRVGQQALQLSRTIVDAARDLVAEGGLEAVTLRPLLERSGLARRAFYERFESIDDVILALFEDTMQTAAVGLAEHVAEIEGAPERIEAIVRHMASMARRPSERLLMLSLSSEHVRLAERRPADLEEAIAPMNGMMAGILEEGMKEGTVRKTDPDALAAMIHSFVASEIHRNLNLGRKRRDHRWIDEICEFCLRGISGP